MVGGNKSLDLEAPGYELGLASGGYMISDLLFGAYIGVAAICRNNEGRRKRQVFVAGETCREQIANFS